MLTYSRTVSPQYSFDSSISFTRSTPGFPTPNHTDPAVKFNDGLFEAFNAAAGSVMQAYGNLFQARQNFVYIAGRHVWKFGGEIRLNRDTTYFGTSPNGEYDFGGGTAYSPVEIPSQSGTHDVHVGDPLPDTLSALLTGSPFAYNVAVAPPYFSGGDHIGPAAINRNNFAFCIAGHVENFRSLCAGLWLALRGVYTDYGAGEADFELFANETAGSSGICCESATGIPDKLQRCEPRVQLDWRVTDKLHVRAGGGNDGDSAEYLAGQFADRIDTVCGVSALELPRRARSFTMVFRSRRMSCRAA